MRSVNINIRMLIAFCILLAGAFVADSVYLKRTALTCIENMEAAVAQAQGWFKIIDDLKEERDLVSDALSNVPNSFMIGDEWSAITSSLGSLEAKEISTNPDFAALVVRYLYEAGIEKGDKVGLIISGSFPSLAVSSLAALQTIGAEVVMMSSLAASTYGANQPQLTWIDMEKELIRKGDLEISSVLVSAGATNDCGQGLMEEGPELLHSAAKRNGVDLYMPGNLVESIEHRVDVFTENNIRLLINIGGNEAAMGACSHTLGIPNGLNYKTEQCKHIDRGVISRMNEQGVPFVNMLNIKELAARYGIDVAPGIEYANSVNLFTETKTNKLAIGLILLLGLIPIWFLRKN